MNNESKENNTIKLKKDVVKNIAIVFLSIMLILTFFSNSIMNKSLPEVATKYIQSETITEKIRGTGVIEADDPYSVMVKDSRVIHSVAVKEGDTVSKDQFLFYLEEGDSEELDKAQKDLEDLIYKYTAGALSGEMSAQAYNQATSGQVSSMAVYEAQILAAKQRVKTAQENVDSIARQQTVASGSTDSDSDLNQAKLDLEEAQIKLNTAKAKYDELKAVVDAGNSNTTSAQSEKDAAELELANAKAKYETKQDAIVAQINDTSITAFKNAYDNKYSALNSKNEVSELLFYGTDPNKDEKKAINDADALNDWIYATKSTIAEAEKMLAKYPHSFKAVYGCAYVYCAFGAGNHDSHQLKRALDLFEQSKVLLPQNDDPHISEATISGSQSIIWFLLGEKEKSIRLLKKYNAGGNFSSEIGAFLSIYGDDPEEAAPFLSEALYSGL